MIGDFLRWTELYRASLHFSWKTLISHLALQSIVVRTLESHRKACVPSRFALVLVFPKFLCRSCSSVCAPFRFGGVCETSSPFIALRQAPFIVLFCPSFHSGTAISPLLSPPFLMRIKFHRSCFPQQRPMYFASG